jgi:NAD(P)-dependent dehydrogenase (short-subunit alcohol dehydrogenase family)
MARYLVVGGSRGIGLSITEELLTQGHEVIVLSRTEGGLPTSGLLTYIPFDATVNEMPDIGIDQLDGMVYCPGSIVLKPFHRLSADDIRGEMEVNTFGAVRVLQHVYPQLKKNGGSVVLFSTVAVRSGMAFHAGIAMTKGALEGLCRSLAAEWAPSIRVNAIAPSLTRTDLAEKLLNTPEKLEASGKRHLLGRVGEAADQAAMAVFLLTDKITWITGQVIGINGGMSMA